jgi:hypothetical protein
MSDENGDRGFGSGLGIGAIVILILLCVAAGMMFAVS